jgi:predicted nucleic acid-binding protein
MISLQKQLENFPIFWPSEDDCNRALVTFANLMLSHGIEVIDTLIAQTAISLDVPIVTLNEKHFKPLAGVKILIPYK